MGRVLSAIAVTPSVAVLAPFRLALTAGCEVVQWCADQTATAADLIAETAAETADLARWVASIGRGA